MWLSEIRMLCQIAKSESQSAYICFTTGLKHKIMYYMRTVPKIGHLLQQIDDLILSDFIPAITGDIRVSELERRLLALPVKLQSWTKIIELTKNHYISGYGFKN